MATRVNGYWSSGAVLLGGDFNVYPHDSRLSTLYATCYSNGSGRFYDLDSGNCSRTTSTTVNELTHSAYKIDYLFVSSEFRNRMRQGVRQADRPASHPLYDPPISGVRCETRLAGPARPTSHATGSAAAHGRQT